MFYSKPSPIEWRYTEAGQKVRVSVRTGRIIPIPRAAEETYDYKTKGSYIGKHSLSVTVFMQTEAVMTKCTYICLLSSPNELGSCRM